MRKHRMIMAGIVCSVTAALVLLAIASPAHAQQCQRTVTASVVALDQPFMWNRLGTAQPQGMIFALERDVVSSDTPLDTYGNDVNPERFLPLKAGNVRLRSGKRARPLVLRANVEDCLQIHFRNLLSPTPPASVGALLPHTRNAGVHVMGLELVGSIDSDASWVGGNPGAVGSYARPGETKTYTYYAKAEGTFLLYSLDDDASGNGQLGSGLFGAVNVQPDGAEWYRGQVTRGDLHLATYNASALPENMHLKPTVDGQGKQITARVEGKEVPVWTLTTVNPERQTVGTAQVVKLEGDDRLYTLSGHPVLNYQAVYPSGARQGTPILSMLQKRADGTLEIVHSDLTAIITGPNADRFPYTNVSPSFRQNPASPDRRQPYREFTIVYHNANPVQAFQDFYDPALAYTLGAGADFFAINYGMAGIGAEVLANRLGVGPMGNKDAVDLKFEEFFLTSWAVGDPAMVVDVPANTPNQVVSNPAQGANVTDTLRLGEPVFKPLKPQKATKAFYPDDPSNVYHSYMRDHVKFRVLSASFGPVHVHHLHAHQWLHSPNSDDGHYLDSQILNPGSAYTLEIVYGGSGNRNLTVGDSIFHCHFYPHFAAGMWSLWRVHDVFERGTLLDQNGRPQPGARALPDGEIENGTPIPAVVPLPTLAMAPMPAQVKLIDSGRRVEVLPEQVVDGKKVYKNPGFPFFVPGVAGHRAPHPPIDFAWEEEDTGQPKLYTAADEQAGKGKAGKKVLLDGGLPRHLVLDGEVVREFHTRWDFTKDFVLYDKEDKTALDRKAIAGGLIAFELPEEGTAVEQAAMAMHAQRTHASFQPDGEPGNFTLNGLPPAPGAPFADPNVDDNGNAIFNTRRYKAAVVQMDVVLNKKGWHYPQQRFITLWDDVKPTVQAERAPQPFFFRANTGETIEYWHTNLVPDYYELDDFQVRTPTDILGQHIHLVKFDVLASDGATNGFNYEDGTFSPDEVRTRIDAINLKGGLYGFDEASQFIDRQKQTKLVAKPAPAIFGSPPSGQNWTGAQTTIQRWDTDPLLNNQGEDRTLRTVFTHDHFGPSTHQQIGLYAGFLVEPEGSTWYDPITGDQMYDTKKRLDGGPTSWQANIITADPADSYREFALEFQDLQLAYTSGSRATAHHPTSALFNVETPPPLSPDTGKIPEDLQRAFKQNGISLSPKATMSKPQPGSPCADTPGSEALITDTGGQDQGAAYCLAANTDSSIGLQVYALNMPPGWSDPHYALSPPSDGNKNGAPYPTLISANTKNGTFSLMYRNEPLPLRVNRDPQDVASGLKPEEQQQAVDLSYVFSSIPRLDPAFNTQPQPLSPIDPNQASGFKFPQDLVPTCHPDPTGRPCPPGDQQPTDPYTPLLRAYENDRVQIRTLVGAHLQSHSFQVHGVEWLSEPSYANSGYRNVQGMGLSEHFEMLFTLPPAATTVDRPFADYLYAPSAGQTGLVNGLWGILRAYDGLLPDLQPLPNNPHGRAPSQVQGGCPPGVPVQPRYTVVATTAAQALPGGELVYNSPNNASEGITRITDPLALIYVRADDLDANGKLKPSGPIEPLILRAAAGDCLEITLKNAFDPSFDPSKALLVSITPVPPQDVQDLDAGTIPQDVEQAFQNKGISLAGATVESIAVSSSWIITAQNETKYSLIKQTNTLNAYTITPFTYPAGAPAPFGNGPPAIALTTSTRVGLHPQLVGYDISAANGMNVGFNPEQTVAPGESRTFRWYAGDISSTDDGRIVATPIEFGALSLVPSDPLMQDPKGLVGALIIEPQGASWVEDANTRASATVTKADGSQFREFVLVMQNTLEVGPGTAFNYRTEPITSRYPSPTLAFTTAATSQMIEDLDKGQIPKQLVDQFAANGYPLYFYPLDADTASVTVNAPGNWWTIDGGNSITFVSATYDSRILLGTDDRGQKVLTVKVYFNPVHAPAPALTDVSAAVSDTQVQGEPQTPVFVAAAGTPVRFRVVYAGGDGDQVFAVHGHGWQEEPYVQNSTVIGSNPLSQWLGFEQVSPYQGVNLVLESAGGTFHVPGDYLYHAFLSQYYGFGGLWGVLRVNPPGKDAVIVAQAVVDEKTQQLTIAGVNSVNPTTGRFAARVMLSALRDAAPAPEPLGSVPVNPQDGTWVFRGIKSGVAPGISIRAQSAQGGEDTTTLQSAPAPEAVILRAPAPLPARPALPFTVLRSARQPQRPH